jgi:hypothetical protein
VIVTYFISVNLPGATKETIQTSGEAGSDLDKLSIGVCKLLSNQDHGRDFLE